MSPNRKRNVNGKLVEEFYWAGDYVTYVDNRLSALDFDDVVANLIADSVPNPPVFTDAKEG